MPNHPQPGVDDVDRAMLELLARDARITNQRLAERVGVAPSTALARLRSLRDRGVIRGFHAEVDLAALGRPLQALIAVRLAVHARDQIDDFTSAVRQLPGVLMVFHLTGVTDYLVWVAAADAQDLREFVVDHLATHPSVAHAETSLIYEHHRGPGIWGAADPSMSPASRLDGLGTTIFTEMTALAARTGAINLGQGFPDTDGPASVIEAAVAALRAGENQYAPLPGVPALREAVVGHQRSWYGLDPEDVLITFGATEAIAAALLGLCDPGDEVVVLEPYYDSYAACIAFAGARAAAGDAAPAGVRARRSALRAAIGPRARVLLLNIAAQPDRARAERAELERSPRRASSTT